MWNVNDNDGGARGNDDPYLLVMNGWDGWMGGWAGVTLKIAMWN